jgi:hypothetical protein
MLTLSKPALPAKQIAACEHMTSGDVYRSLKDMRRYTLRIVFKGRITNLDYLEPMTYKQARTHRNSWERYPRRSVEIIRIH